MPSTTRRPSPIRQVLEQVRPLLDRAFPGVDPERFYPAKTRYPAGTQPPSAQWVDALRRAVARDQSP